MNVLWPQVARRIVEALGVEPGDLIQVREGTGRFDVFQEISLAVELAAATPVEDSRPLQTSVCPDIG